ncbi:U4/U6 small nuclear ribonucleoprotein Prp3 [Metarhizium anisopliae]|nr:U4/U6 small nuclear ribonucleoprotein Prp3 [Metarhizium anisopliae]
MDPSKMAGLGPHRDASARIQKPDTSLDRLAALKARVAAATGASKAKGDINSLLEDPKSRNSSLVTRDLPIKTAQPRAQQHAGQSPYRTPAANSRKFGQAMQSDAMDNPYLDENPAHQSSGSRQREPRRLVFNQKGKYIQQANALRRQAALEAMKKRIAEQTRKAGISEDLDVEKNFVIEQPPDVEWWDEGLIDGSSYEQIGNPSSLKIISPDSIVTEYIQHPVALEPPQDRHVLENKAMFLTSKEQAKIRRQRRMAELKEMQAKIRLGLIPAPPPKVKKGNLMRVLGDGMCPHLSLFVHCADSVVSVAVKDPTAVEARVNREIAERHQKHVKLNEDRKLSKDQKNEKLSKNQQRDADKGIYLLVFKISSLANGQHRYKIGMNATQLALSGTCIMHPKFNLVIVEGGSWSINKYKKLMLNRIDWTENSPSRRGDDRPNSERDWLQAEDQDGALKDMSLNECRLIFEGEQKARVFRRWSSKVCETDAEAREALARVKLETFWSLAKGTLGIS